MRKNRISWFSKFFRYVQTYQYMEIEMLRNPTTITQNLTATTPENLLLSYTYFLNDSHTCKIVVGFDPNDFSAKLVLHRCPNKPVPVNYSEWTAFQAKISRPGRESSVPQSLRLVFGPKGCEKIFLLKPKETVKFYELLDFLNSVMYFNTNAVESIQEYFNTYVVKCREKGVITLSSEHFFIPMRASYARCNYSRLFYEIPIFCSQKIFNDLLLFSDPEARFSGILNTSMVCEK